MGVNDLSGNQPSARQLNTEEEGLCLIVNNEKLSEIIFTLKNKTNIDIIHIYSWLVFVSFLYIM